MGDGLEARDHAPCNDNRAGCQGRVEAVFKLAEGFARLVYSAALSNAASCPEPPVT